MAEVVNLNKVRKQRDRARKEEEAANNRVRSGRTKAEKLKGKQELDHSRRILDGKKLDDPA